MYDILSGYIAPEIVGQHITMLFPPGIASMKKRIFLRRLSRGEHVDHYDTVRPRKDGQRIDVSVTLWPLRDEAGAIIGVSKITRDITERKRAQALLQQQLEFWRVALASIGEGVIITDDVGRVLFMNKEVEALTGSGGAAAAGRPVSDVFVTLIEETKAPVESLVDRAIAERIPVKLPDSAVLLSREGRVRSIDKDAGTAGEKGLKIGLKVAKQLTELHGGTSPSCHAARRCSSRTVSAMRERPKPKYAATIAVGACSQMLWPNRGTSPKTVRSPGASARSHGTPSAGARPRAPRRARAGVQCRARHLALSHQQRRGPVRLHPANRLRWWQSFGSRLRRIGAFIRRHRMRVSMHPGQFTVLNSAVVRVSMREPVWHARLLDALGTDATSKISIHVGGMVDGPEAAIERFVCVARALPEAVCRRLIVENDERLFTAEQVLSVSRATGLPVAFDWLHHRANPGSARTPSAAAGVVAACFDARRGVDGVPKIHLSSQARGARRGRHGDWVRPSGLLSFLAIAPPRPFDCMIEARKRDLALFRLRRDLGRAGVPEHGRARAA